MGEYGGREINVNAEDKKEEQKKGEREKTRLANGKIVSIMRQADMEKRTGSVNRGLQRTAERTERSTHWSRPVEGEEGEKSASLFGLKKNRRCKIKTTT